MKKTLNRLALPLVLAAAALASCSSAPDEPEPLWRDLEVSAPSDTVLWRVTLLSIRKMGFPLGAGLDQSALVAETGWKNDLAPFKGDGFRSMAEVRMRPVGPGRWSVRARVKKQVNQSIVRPLDLRYAEWEWVEDDERATAILLQHIRSFLDDDLELRDRPDDPVEAYLEERAERGADSDRP